MAAPLLAVTERICRGEVAGRRVGWNVRNVRRFWRGWDSPFEDALRYPYPQCHYAVRIIYKSLGRYESGEGGGYIVFVLCCKLLRENKRHRFDYKHERRGMLCEKEEPALFHGACEEIILCRLIKHMMRRTAVVRYIPLCRKNRETEMMIKDIFLQVCVT